MYHFKIWMAVKLKQQRTTMAWKILWKWINLQMWISGQFGFSWLGPQLSHEVLLWSSVFWAVTLRSSGALPIVTHGCIWTPREGVKGEKAYACVCGHVHNTIWGTQYRWWSKAGRLSCRVTKDGRLPGGWLATVAYLRCIEAWLPVWPRQLVC